MNRIKLAFNYLLNRMGEASFWQALGFVVGVVGGVQLDYDWGQAAAAGGGISAFIKFVFPDKFA